MTSIFHTPEMMFFTMLSVLFLALIIAKVTRVPGIIALIIGGVIVGPYCLNILPLNDTVKSFATIGLIFLMFTVGLEIDLSQFQFYRKRAIIFFLLTYLIPQLSGLIIGPILGLSFASSILLGAIYASYTLVAYPIASKMGIIKDKAVAISVCASVFCDVTALFILAIVMHAHAGNFTWASLVDLAIMIIVCSATILFVIPYLGRLFFRFFSDGKINFPFVLVVLFASSTVAQVVGMNAVIGAFLGGLAVNRMVTPSSRVFRQIVFTGDTIFIPLFLISIGVHLNLAKIFSSWTILIIGLILTVTVYVTKLAAAWIAAWLFKYSRPQMWTMWGLTHAQAAATLAIILVGTRAHLFDDTILQGAIVMVLFTLISSPLIVKYFGAQLVTDKGTKRRFPLLQSIMVPVDSDDFPDYTLEFAARLARHGKGELMILNLAETAPELETRREILRAGPLKQPGTTVNLVNRIQDADLSQEIIHEAIESEISLIMLRWETIDGKRGHLFSDLINATMWDAPRPVAVVSLNNPIKSFKRVIAVIGEHMVGIKLEAEFPGVAQTISRALDLPLTVMGKTHYLKWFRSKHTRLIPHTVNMLFNFPVMLMQKIPYLNRFRSEKAKAIARTVSKTLHYPLKATGRSRYLNRFRFKKANLFQLHSFDFIPITGNIVDTVLTEVGKGDLVLISTMNAKERFEKKSNLVTYNLCAKTEASLIVLHFD